MLLLDQVNTLRLAEYHDVGLTEQQSLTRVLAKRETCLSQVILNIFVTPV